MTSAFVFYQYAGLALIVLGCLTLLVVAGRIVALYSTNRMEMTMLAGILLALLVIVALKAES